MISAGRAITLDQWLASENDANLPPLCCVFTDEPLFLTQAGDLYRKKLKQRGDAQREVIELDRSFKEQEFLALFAEVSLFGDSTLVDLRLNQPKLNKEHAEVLSKVSQWIAQGQSTNCLLVTGPKLNKTAEKSAGFADLIANGTRIECRDITVDNLPAWIQSTAKRHGIVFEPMALQWLTEKSEGNLLAIHQAIERLRIDPPQGPVSLDLVQASISNSARFNVFDLGACALSADTKRLSRMIEGLEAEGEAATLVLWALQEEVRAIRDVKASLSKGIALSEACKQHRIWGSRQQFMSTAVKRHNVESLTQLSSLCYLAEKSIKGVAKANPWNMLQMIGMGLAGVKPIPALVD